MPRRGSVPKREVLADPLYNSVVVTKLINGIMYDGKKGVAQQIVYDAFAAVEEKTGKPVALKASPFRRMLARMKRREDEPYHL